MLTVLIAAAVQLRYRQSLGVGEDVSGAVHPSPSASPTAGRRSTFEGHRDADESAAAHPVEPRRRRFAMVASLALRKSVDGPHHEEDEEVTAKRLRSLLAKTSAANVGAVAE